MIALTNPTYVFARGLLALLFIVAGVRKLFAYKAILGYFAAIGIPAPEIVLPLTILLEIGGGLLLLLGWRAGWIAIALAVFSVAAGLLGHRFWAVQPAQFSDQLNHFLKNLALAGGLTLVALIEFARSHVPGRI